jgi:hypothetical protein
VATWIKPLSSIDLPIASIGIYVKQVYHLQPRLNGAFFMPKSRLRQGKGGFSNKKLRCHLSFYGILFQYPTPKKNLVLADSVLGFVLY